MESQVSEAEVRLGSCCLRRADRAQMQEEGVRNEPLSDAYRAGWPQGGQAEQREGARQNE